MTGCPPDPVASEKGRRGSRRASLVLGWLLAFVAATTAPASAQTIRGTLLDTETNEPIPLGLVMMFHESGDSITATMSDEHGAFVVASPEPGSFVLLAGALGYHETPAGVFELGEGGSISVRYGLRPRPVELDEIVVTLDRPTTIHHLVRNGFVRRLQRGLGVFITPHAIEESTARSTEQLLTGRPGIRVGPVYTKPSANVTGDIQVRLPRTDIGEAILVAGPTGWCMPTLYVDGVRSFYDPDAGLTLSSVAGIDDVEAVEVYRRPAEIPVEYDPGPGSNCGVIVAWTKTGLAPGQRPGGDRRAEPEVGLLPAVSARGDPPVAGERIRVQLPADAARASGLGSPWEGYFERMEEAQLVASDMRTGRFYAMPRGDVEAVQVQRPRAPGHAYARAGVTGAVAAAGTYAGLKGLCAWSDCEPSAYNGWLPAAIVGVLVGYAMFRKGPGNHWVETTLPDVGADSGGVGLSWTVPTSWLEGRAR